jgi:hypothetical protein
VFQSAPRSRDRGDLKIWFPISYYKVFQSAPRSRDRGDLWVPFTVTGFQRAIPGTGGTNANIQ